jgi:diphthamide biosynthesis methyltransferase
VKFIKRAAAARDIATHNWIGVGLGGMGHSNQIVRAGKLDFLEQQIWNIFPQSLIVCGNLQEYEREALEKLGGMK